MKVAFLHAGQDPTCARIMIGSVRRHMPGVEIVHMADDDCPALPEADSCVRVPWSGLKEDATVWRLKHLAAMDGEILSLDTDVVLQRDLGRVFDWDFDWDFDPKPLRQFFRRVRATVGLALGLHGVPVDDVVHRF